MSIALALSMLTDAELERMQSRAWGRASRSWHEVNTLPRGTSNSLRMMLVAEAESADDYWHTLQMETLRRVDARRSAA